MGKSEKNLNSQESEKTKKEVEMGKKRSQVPLPPQYKIPVGVALIFIGLYLLNQNQQLYGIISIIIGVILIAR